MSSTPNLPSSPPALAPAHTRLLSLDAFRGLVIFTMFLVNVGGTDPAFQLGTWAPEAARSWMPHMGWNAGRMGNGLADYVFPWFLFIVGVAIPFSMSSGRGQALSPARRVFTAFIRGLIIYLLGSLLWAASIGYKPADPAARYLGPITLSIFKHWDILPLIGFGYFAGVVLYLLPRWVQVAFLLTFLMFKWWTIQGMQTASADWLKLLEGRSSMHHLINRHWGWWGVLVTQGLAAACLVLLGSWAGQILRSSHWPRAVQVRNLLISGGGVTLVALVWWLLLGFPFSKDYFSSSYILIAAGTGTLLLAAMVYIIDLRKWTTLPFLRVFGLNALFVYIFAELTWKTILMQWHVKLPAAMQPADVGAPAASSVAITAFKAHLQSWTNQTLGTYLLVALYILTYWLFCYALYRKKWFVKV